MNRITPPVRDGLVSPDASPALLFDVVDGSLTGKDIKKRSVALPGRFVPSTGLDEVAVAPGAGRR
jgi:hypothetical protein